MSSNSWEVAIREFLENINVTCPRLPDLLSSIFEFYCYCERALNMESAGYMISANNLKNGVFVVHYKPGNRMNVSHLVIFKEDSSLTYYMYLNVEVRGKSGVDHYPDVTIFSSEHRVLPPHGILWSSTTEKLVCICECKKVSRLSLGNAREFLGYKTELPKPYKVPPSEKHIRFCIYTTGHVPRSVAEIAKRYDFDIDPIDYN